jgi:hypothetical protein
MSYSQVLSGLDILQEHKEISEYIKDFDGNGGFMFTRETDPIKIQLSDDMEKLLDDGSHSGSSWGWMMRLIQSVLNGNATKEEIIELDIKQKEEYRVLEEEYRIREELKRIKDEEDRIACVLNSEEKSNTPVAGEVQLCEVAHEEEEQSAVVEEQSAVVEEQSAVLEEQSAVVEEQSAVVEEQSAVVEEQSAVVEEQSAVVEETNVVTLEQDCVARDIPYRACIYDFYDEKYATLIKSMKYPEEFNTFTQGLMDEPRINRGCLLNAINDYHSSKSGPRLSDAFQNNAFNYRPYQTW